MDHESGAVDQSAIGQATQSGFTPGPWQAADDLSKAHSRYYDGARCVVAPSEQYAPVVCTTSHGWEDGGVESEANAHLIAAAPDMFAYCKFMAANGCPDAEELVRKIEGRTLASTAMTAQAGEPTQVSRDPIQRIER